MISVILVTYNSRPVLPNCLESLENTSTAKELQIILVDNGSVDGTVEWLSAYEQSASFPFANVITVTLPDNRGYAYANNRAMEHAHGDIILLLNPDTVVGNDAISTCATVLAGQDNIGAVGCRLILPDGRLDKACKRSFPTLWNSFARLSGLSLLFPNSRWFAKYNLTYLHEYGSYPVDCLSGAFMMVPLTVKRSVGGLDEDYFMYGEDIDWCYRIKRANYRIWYEGSVSTIHLKGGNGGKHSRQSLYHFYDTMFVYYVKTLGRNGKSVMAYALRLGLRMLFHVHLLFRGIR